MKKVKGAKLFEDSEVKPTNFADDGVYTEYVIEGIIPGLNSDKGLMRSHWSKVKKEKDKYKWLIKWGGGYVAFRRYVWAQVISLR